MIDIRVNRVVPLDLWLRLSAVLKSGKPSSTFMSHPEPTAGKLLVKAVRKYLKDAGVEDAQL